DEVALLQRAQPHHPADFWLNVQLASALVERAGRSRPARRKRPLTPGERDLLHEAARFYQAALALRPDGPGGWSKLSGALYECQELGGAIASHRQAIACDPRYAGAHDNLGVALYDRKDLTGASASFKKAIACDPRYGQAHYNLGAILYGRQELQAASACFKK